MYTFPVLQEALDYMTTCMLVHIYTENLFFLLLIMKINNNNYSQSVYMHMSMHACAYIYTIVLGMKHNLYIYTRSVARFARPLFACACISFVYILHGRLLLVPLYSMSKLNNNGSKARYSNRVPAFTNY